jgi:hypothetical protein
MTAQLKAEILPAILNLAPTKSSCEEFQRLAAKGDVAGMWTFYQRAIATRRDVELSVAKAQKITFEMLEPAMKAIYDLPTSDKQPAR